MTPHDAFLAAIIENIADDAPRLIYADYLEEHGQADRAEFIRVQCELAKCKDGRESCPPTARCGRCIGCVLRRRERELLKAPRSSPNGTKTTAEFAWAYEAFGNLIARGGCVAWERYDGGRWELHGEHSWRRGFVAEITLTCADWLAHRERLLRDAPLEKVTLTQIPWQQKYNTHVILRGQPLSVGFGDGRIIDLSF